MTLRVARVSHVGLARGSPRGGGGGWVVPRHIKFNVNVLWKQSNKRGIVNAECQSVSQSISQRLSSNEGAGLA